MKSYQPAKMEQKAFSTMRKWEYMICYKNAFNIKTKNKMENKLWLDIHDKGEE